MLKWMLMAGLLCSRFLPVCSQVIVTGKFVDDKSYQAIGSATVSLLSLKDSSLLKSLITDSSGVFVFTGFPAGSYLLHCSALGYRPLYRQVLMEKERSRDWQLGSIALSADASLLNEVVVTGEKPAIQLQPGKLVVNVAGNKLFTTSAHALDILKRVPGLEVGGDGSLLMSGRVIPAVFIDGKPVPMGAEELRNYLTSLSPEMIASIEIIQNPSSQYDGVYKGIINILLKPDRSLGWKGILTMNAQRNAYTLAEPQLLLTYKTHKMVYTARWGYATGNTVRRYEALQHLANTNIMATHTKMLTGNNNFNYQLGADYTISKTQRIEMLLRSYRLNRTTDSYNTLYTTDSAASKVVSNTSSINHASLKQRNYAVNLNYGIQTGKTRWQLQSSLLSIVNRQQEDIQNSDELTELLEDYWKTISKNEIWVRTIQSDGSGELAGGKWSIGGKLVLNTTKNDLRYDTLNTDHVFEVDSSRTNRFQYDENVMAVYIAYEKKWKSVHVSTGLRAEQTHSIADSGIQGQVTERTYVNWLPSLGITYTMNRNRQWQLSLSRRITRPDFAQLNPFRFYFSPLNYWVGNPYLRPSVTTALQLSYSMPLLTASIQIGREKDPLSRYPEYDSATNILQYLGRNLPYNNFARIEIGFPLSVTSWWRMNHNLGCYYKKELTPYHEARYAIPIYNFILTGSQVFTLPKAFSLDIYYYYNTVGGDGLYTAKPLSNIDIGLQRSWLKGKLNTKVNFYDVFDTYRVKRIFREKSIINNQLMHWFGTQRLAIMISYHFGQSMYKAKQSGKNEEESRAGW